MTNRPPGRLTGGTGVALAFVLVVALERPRTAAAAEPPAEAHAIIVLDSSGSMRETVDARDSGDPLGLVDSAEEGELVGDDPSSKLAQAKRVLLEALDDGPTGLRIHLAKYSQSAAPADFGPERRDRFLYATSDPRAAQLVVNPRGDGSTPPGLKRSARDHRRVGSETTYYLFAGRFWNGERVEVLPDGSQPRVAAVVPGGNPAFVEIQTVGRSGHPVGAPIRFNFKGIRWNKANRAEDPADRAAVLVGNASCDGVVALASEGGELARHLGPEVRIAQDGSIDGYKDGALGSAATSPPAAAGIRASGLTPLAGTFLGIRQLLSSSWADLRSGRTFVVLLTDGDDTCADARTGDLTVSRADERALRAAHQAALLYREEQVPTMIVSFGTGVSATRSQWIAWAGTGLTRPVTGEGSAARWASPPSQEDRKACRSCSDAFMAASSDELASSLRRALDRGLKLGAR